MHEGEGLGRALASLLANKLSSRTLLPMQLAGLFVQAYQEDEVRAPSSLRTLSFEPIACSSQEAACLAVKQQ